MIANHDDTFYFKRGIQIDVKRGQVGRSEVELSDRWGWSRTKVRAFLSYLEKEQQIKTHKSNITQLLTIINFKDFQGKEQQENSRSAAEVQQKDTYKNEKNINKIIPRELNTPEFIELYERWIVHLEQKRKNLTIPAIETQLMQLMGNPINQVMQVLEYSISVNASNLCWNIPADWAATIKEGDGKSKKKTYKQIGLENPGASSSKISRLYDEQ
jgi:hypothetical protein